MIAPEQHSSSLRRIALRAALLVAPLVGLALAAPRLISGVLPGHEPAERPGDRPPTEEEIEASRAADERLAKAQKPWRSGTAIASGEAATDASGETVRWFEGFGVSVESTPADAQVLVDGRDMGRTPIVASVACDPGDEVHVEVRKPPRHAQQRTTRCRENQLVELRFELK